jgi:hypothetical protein
MGAEDQTRCFYHLAIPIDSGACVKADPASGPGS